MLEEEGDQSLPIREWKMSTFLHTPYPLFIVSTHPLMGLLQISPLAFQNLNSQLKNLKTAISPKPLNQILNNHSTERESSIPFQWHMSHPLIRPESKVMPSTRLTGAKWSQTKSVKIMDMSHIPISNIPKDENDPTLRE